MSEFEDLLSVRDAAAHLGVTRGMAYRYCKTGALPSVVSPLGYLVHRRDVCALRARRTTNGGRPNDRADGHENGREAT